MQLPEIVTRRHRIEHSQQISVISMQVTEDIHVWRRAVMEKRMVHLPQDPGRSIETARFRQDGIAASREAIDALRAGLDPSSLPEQPCTWLTADEMARARAGTLDLASLDLASKAAAAFEEVLTLQIGSSNFVRILGGMILAADGTDLACPAVMAP